MKVTDEMVTRFLGWKLPQDFLPDCGISFTPYMVGEPLSPLWPIGTNLLHAGQARAMLEHVLGEATDGDAAQRELAAYKRALQDELDGETKLAQDSALCEETAEWEKHRYAIACLRNAMKMAAKRRAKRRLPQENV